MEFNEKMPMQYWLQSTKNALLMSAQCVKSKQIFYLAKPNLN